MRVQSKTESVLRDLKPRKEGKLHHIPKWVMVNRSQLEEAAARKNRTDFNELDEKDKMKAKTL